MNFHRHEQLIPLATLTARALSDDLGGMGYIVKHHPRPAVHLYADRAEQRPYFLAQSFRRLRIPLGYCGHHLKGQRRSSMSFVIGIWNVRPVIGSTTARRCTSPG